ncbi:protein rolling stone-like isoform X1 [Glossina fuscipes]|uniref:Protein rolling stone-like isoform X1 n=2 Tax=Glossina fuscipes TaxID=7396 RepID=A0A9C6DZ80_9MUSC|nr:protein rolling stone-like isoform X1 [Glossina fuscipes]
MCVYKLHKDNSKYAYQESMHLTGKFAKRKRLCNEFQVRNFGFNHNRVDQFYRSQWQSGERSWFYLIYRWIWMLCFAAVFLVCLSLQYSDGKYFIFMTNWGVILGLLTQFVAAVLVTRWQFNINSLRSNICEMGTQGSPTTPLVKVYWLLHGVTMSVSLVITTVYWSILHGKMNKPMRFPVLSFVTHCLNSVFMLVDFLMVGFPVRVLHTVYAMLLPIIYFSFTIVYFLCGGVDEYGNHYVYPILDWTSPMRGVITFAGVFTLYCIYAIVFYSIYQFKRFLHRSFSTIWSPHCVGLI